MTPPSITVEEKEFLERSVSEALEPPREIYSTRGYLIGTVINREIHWVVNID